MSRFEVRVTGGRSDEVYNDDTERMAVNRFCEILGNDAVELHPRFPVGARIALHDLERDKVLMRYVVGYE